MIEDAYVKEAIRHYENAARAKFLIDQGHPELRGFRFASLLAAGAYCSMAATHRTGYTVERLNEIYRQEHPTWLEDLCALI